jgi:hypothetical protein
MAKLFLAPEAAADMQGRPPRATDGRWTYDIFYAVGRERGILETSTTTLDLAIRTSRVIRRIDGSWHQLHHHGPFDDPQRLAAYQRAVR